MVKTLPATPANKPTKIATLVRDTLVSWENQKKTGKLTIEVHVNQGGIAGCNQKIESKFL